MCFREVIEALLCAHAPSPCAVNIAMALRALVRAQRVALVRPYLRCIPWLRSLSSAVADLYVHEYSPPEGQAIEGRPVVFIHGLLGSGTNFRTYQLKVAAHRPTLAVDLRNHGRSPHSAAPMTLALLAEDVAAVIRKHYPSQPVDVVGHSLGGKTAMVLAGLHPALLRTLVVVDIAPVAYDTRDAQWRNVDAIVRAAHALQPERYATRGAVDAELAKAVADAGVRSFVSQNLVPAADGTYRWRINTACIRDSMEAFASFPPHVPGRDTPPPGPVHFISGSQSSYIAQQHLPAIAARFPGAAVHTVEGAGHWVHADKPKEFWALLAKLLGMPA